LAILKTQNDDVLKGHFASWSRDANLHINTLKIIDAKIHEVGE